MGAYDFYCAFCGGPFNLDHRRLFSLPSAALFHQYPLEQLLWLHELRVIGRNLATGEAYLTESGTAEEYGWALVERGDDPNVPHWNRGGFSSGDGSMVGLPCYFDWNAMGDGDDGSGFPVHACCFEILQQAFDHRKKAAGRRRRRAGSLSGAGKPVLDLGLLKRVMETQRHGATEYLGGMDYVEFDPRRGDDVWGDDEAAKARLLWLADPIRPLNVKIPLVEPRPADETATATAPAAAAAHESARTARPGAHDGFDGLPTELLQQMLDQLDSHEMLSLYDASPSMRARCDDYFWKQRIMRDMPYLSDLHAQASKLESETAAVDWQKLYRQMLVESYPPLEPCFHTKQDEGSLGVASRRRIWQCADQLLNLYESRQEEELAKRRRRYSRSIKL